jgi:hypothetical protein
VHWDGSAWSQVAVPALGGIDSGLAAVAALTPQDAWAVGQAADSTETLILHWDGSSWQQVPSPSPAGYSQLEGIHAVSAANIWAVGQSGRGSAMTTLVLHWNGAAWTQVPSPSPPGGSQLASVSATSGRNAWAVGETGQDSLILHWNGPHLGGRAGRQLPGRAALERPGLELSGPDQRNGLCAWA